MRAVYLFLGIAMGGLFGGLFGGLVSGLGIAAYRSWRPPGPMPYGDWESPIILLASVVLGAIAGTFVATFALRNAKQGRWLWISRFFVTSSTIIAMIGAIGCCLFIPLGPRIAALCVIVSGPLIWFPLTMLAAWDLRRNPEKHGWGRTVFVLVMGTIFTVVLIQVVSR